jgi:hypothetical protein
MSTTRVLVRADAKVYAQEDSSLPLLNASGDYDKCIDSAIQRFGVDRPRHWMMDYTVVASAFRFALFGTGTIMPTSGITAWVDGFSQIVNVWHPFRSATQGIIPIDPNSWRVVDDPGPKTILEFLEAVPVAGDVIRLEYTAPHVVDETTVTSTTVRAGDVEAFKILTAAIICEQAAIRYAQNTGNTNLQADTVDRRTQSDVMKSRAKNLWDRYKALMGVGSSDDGPGGASGFKDLDVGSSHGLGYPWHPPNRR